MRAPSWITAGHGDRRDDTPGRVIGKLRSRPAADSELLTVLEIAAAEGWNVERIEMVRRRAGWRVRVTLTHATDRCFVLESDRRGRLRDHQTYVSPGPEVRLLHGVTEVAQALHGTAPRGHTLEEFADAARARRSSR